MHVANERPESFFMEIYNEMCEKVTISHAQIYIYIYMAFDLFTLIV